MNNSLNLCLFCNQEMSANDVWYGLHSNCFKAIFDLPKLYDFEGLVRKNSFSADPTEIKSEGKHLSSFFAGNYPKYEAKLNQQGYILKLGSELYPELPVVEYFCNHLADLLDIPIPKPFALILHRGQLAFATKIFTEKVQGHYSLTHLYRDMEPGEKNYTVAKIVRTIEIQTKNIGDVEIFLEVLLLDALIGNHDRHGRNLAFLETSKGKKLAPIYDNTSVLGLEKGEMLRASFGAFGKIGTQNTSEPGIEDYLQEISRLGKKEVILQFINKLNRISVEKIISTCPAMSENMKMALKNFIGKRQGVLNEFQN